MQSNRKPTYVIALATAAWLISATSWLRVLASLYWHWGTLGELRINLLGLLLFFGVLWEELIRSKRDASDLLLASFALAMVAELVRKVA